MKKFYLLTLFFLFAVFTNAQIKVQGVLRNDIPGTAQSQLRAAAAPSISFSDIKYWVGTGTNEAAFVVQWNDSKNPDALVWGFRWNGTATGADMIKAIAKADQRLFTLLYQGTPQGTAVGGFGFDLDGQNLTGLFYNGNTSAPLLPVNGIVNTTAYNFDGYTAIDTNDHWQSGWATNGYWSYWIKNPASANFGYSGVGASSRVLQNGSWDVWNFNPSFNTVPVSSTLTPVSPYVPSAALTSAMNLRSTNRLNNYTNGFFIVNEEWFGHTNGSVNFLDNNGTIEYRVYSSANNNHAFGATTQYGTIYGDKFYFVSKQAADGGDTQYTPGGRLVVANAQTMEKLASFNDIGGGDGRSFIGVNEHKGYIGASNGIYIFNIDNLTVGNLIPGTEGTDLYSEQIGNMIRTSKHVYAIKQGVGILVIDPNTDAVIHTVSGDFDSVVQAKDGSIWAIQQQAVVNINATTFATQSYNIPTSTYASSWGAWNAGSLAASNTENVLYWFKAGTFWGLGSDIVKFDVTTKAFNETFITIPGQTGSSKQTPYGAALRVNPITGELIVNTTNSLYQKHWVHTYDVNGTLTNIRSLTDYYWFPALTVFPDNTAPAVNNTLPSQITVGNTITIDLKTVVTDTDNFSAAIVKSIKSNSNSSVVSAVINADDVLELNPLSAGTSDIVIKFNSNGKLVEKTLTVNSLGNTLSTAEVKKLQFSIYPNPATDIVYIKTPEKIINVAIYDASGKLINAPFNNGQVNVNMLPKGAYILKATTDKAVYQQKIIKK